MTWWIATIGHAFAMFHFGIALANVWAMRTTEEGRMSCSLYAIACVAVAAGFEYLARAL